MEKTKKKITKNLKQKGKQPMKLITRGSKYERHTGI